MKTVLSFTAATALILAVAGVDANAFTRSATSTGPNGNSRSVDSSASCSGGTCSHSRTVTGPAGNTRTSSGSTSCAGGTCTSSGTATGPRGGTITRSGTISRN